MSTISREQVAHLAMLARIDLSEPELDAMAGELAVILEAFAKVGELADVDVPGMSHPLPLTDVYRADVPAPGLTQDEALAAAPEADEGRFAVPRILTEE
ncbi:MAG: Asp-tRNA(Asn)/Glu-tRNA(Gln) amidotransferase subunit GatC [Austwickia sp.]|jgi:aspartyl-tRNA(Asn)/glutamyl-tRNA(Gln) amidotransferase subunit C|nr:MAG: Asp-tRNA(Asn)/Glu-tRNA(Gln) amidotransferase subunit GatC [Austwickia sp.]